MKQIIRLSREKEYTMIDMLRHRDDIDARRIVRYYDMPDLSRTRSNPVAQVVDRVKRLPRYAAFDDIEIPEVVGTYETFDLFAFPSDHPARSPSDTYYISDTEILRTHTSVSWYYYLRESSVLAELAERGEVGMLSYGKVYRKDEIDRKHMNVFHQIDGLYVCEKSKKRIDRKELENILIELTQGLFGVDVPYRLLDDSFPYTDPSAQIEILVRGEWMEILGSGVLRDEVLANLGIDPGRYNAWAFGPGIDRLALVAKQIPDIRVLWSSDPRITAQWGDLETPYHEVSKYPSTVRDISFVIDRSTSLNDYYGIIQDIAWDLVEEVVLLDTYENVEKFWPDRVSYTWRIVYRSIERTLQTEEVNILQDRIRSATKQELGAELR